MLLLFTKEHHYTKQNQSKQGREEQAIAKQSKHPQTPRFETPTTAEKEGNETNTEKRKLRSARERPEFTTGY